MFGHPEEGFETDFSGGYDYDVEEAPSHCGEGRVGKASTTGLSRMNSILNILQTFHTLSAMWQSQEETTGHGQSGKWAYTTYLTVKPPSGSSFNLQKRLSGYRKLYYHTANCLLCPLWAISFSFNPLYRHGKRIWGIRRLSFGKRFAFLSNLISQPQITANKLKYSQIRNVRLTGEKFDFDLAFKSIQDLQYYSELLRNAIMELRSNTETLIGLHSLAKGFQSSHDNMILSRLSTCTSQFKFNKSWAEDMLDSTKQVSGLVLVRFLYCMKVATNFS